MILNGTSRPTKPGKELSCELLALKQLAVAQKKQKGMTLQAEVP